MLVFIPFRIVVTFIIYHICFVFLCVFACVPLVSVSLRMAVLEDEEEERREQEDLKRQNAKRRKLK